MFSNYNLATCHIIVVKKIIKKGTQKNEMEEKRREAKEIYYLVGENYNDEKENGR